MSTMDDGGPAFPVNTVGMMEPHGGMTLRDYFAAASLPVVAAMMQMAMAHPNRIKNPVTMDEEFVARAAYAYADLMLKERAK